MALIVIINPFYIQIDRKKFHPFSNLYPIFVLFSVTFYCQSYIIILALKNCKYVTFPFAHGLYYCYFGHSVFSKIVQRNSWSHPFAVPIEAGKPRNMDNPEMDLYSNVHVNKLRTGNNRRIVCGGLQWDIYIHPNQGENNNAFALSVFPVKNSVHDKLPDNYKLRYTVTTSLNPRGSLQIGTLQNDDDQKSMARFDHKWTRELNDIVYDVNPKDVVVVGSRSNGINHNRQIDWISTMERLPFNTNDLYQNNCDEDECFNLFISIQTEFIKNSSKRSQYHGVLGAILVRSFLSVSITDFSFFRGVSYKILLCHNYYDHI